MQQLAIIKYPDQKLREAAKPVKMFDADLTKLTQQMEVLMREAEGIGLAATQVGDSRRLIIVDITKGEQPLLVLVNPVITSQSKETNKHEEGCLSIPGIRADVSRPAEVTVTAFNLQGEPLTIEADEILATCLQHEIDHLDGKLFIDHLSRLRRSRLLSQYKKLLAQANEAS